jgi:hypothetical protein
MRKFIIFIFIFIFHINIAHSQDPKAISSLINCAALFRLNADIIGSKNLNGFADSRPEWKKDTLQRFYNPQQAEKARKLEFKALLIVNSATNKANLDNAMSYYYDKWALTIQEDFNISPDRANVSFGRYTQDCSMQLQISEDNFIKGRIFSQNFSDLIEANKYNASQKNESKLTLKNLQKPIPRTDRYIAINMKIGMENEGNVEVEKWLKKYNLQLKLGKSGYFDTYLQKEGLSTSAYIIGPISPAISDQILTSNTDSNFFRVLEKYGVTSNVEKDVFDRANPYKFNDKNPPIKNTNSDLNKADLLQKITTLHPEMFKNLGVLHAFSQSNLLANNSAIENEVKNFSDGLLSSKDKSGTFVIFNSSKNRMLDEIRLNKITLDAQDLSKWINDTVLKNATAYDSISKSRFELIKQYNSNAN